MPSDSQSAPFPRGKTAYNGATIDSNNLMHADWEGRMHWFPNTKSQVDYQQNAHQGRSAFDSTSKNVRRNQRDVLCILVRNVSGGPLYPGRCVQWQAGFKFKRVIGYTNNTLIEPAGIVDDQLSIGDYSEAGTALNTGGVPNNDLFWLTVRGETFARLPFTNTDFPANAGNTIAAGDWVYALTTATSTGGNTANVTAGRVVPWITALTFTAAQATDGSEFKLWANRVGRILTAGAATSGGSSFGGNTTGAAIVNSWVYIDAQMY